MKIKLKTWFRSKNTNLVKKLKWIRKSENLKFDTKILWFKIKFLSKFWYGNKTSVIISYYIGLLKTWNCLFQRKTVKVTYFFFERCNLIAQSQILPSTVQQIRIGSIESLPQRLNFSLKSRRFLFSLSFHSLDLQIQRSDLLFQSTTFCCSGCQIRLQSGCKTWT